MSASLHEAFIAELEQLHDRGWSLVPVPARRKGPVLAEWQKLRLTRAELPTALLTVSNAGVLLGQPSGGLVDIDIDCTEAMRLAPVMLPPTLARFGHGATPESHWLYRVATSIETRKFHDPTKARKDEHATLIELRSTGAQTLVPPSIHPSGELVTWAAQGEPALVDSVALLAAVSRCASAALLARHWPGEGSRHDAALALGGGLLRGGWEARVAARFAGRIARAAGDEEVEDRIRAVLATAETLRDDQETTGWPTLKDLIDPRVVDAVTRWLGMDKDANDDSFSSYESNESTSRDPLAAECRARTIPVPPLPVEIFPPLLQRFLREGAQTVGCPVDLIAVPFLGYVAAANGRQRRLALKRKWIRKGTMWVAVVAASGDGKSPADAYARAALDVLQDEADERFQEQFAAYKRELGSWKARDPATREEEPAPPRYEHWYTTDPTVESLAPMLAANSGVAAAFDELVAWARGCNSYKKGGNDRQKYLELWNGRPLKIDRKTQGVIFVRDPVCCLVGGIQPERLPELASDGSIHDGLVPRFLWTYPDVQPSLWQWDTPDMEDIDVIVELFRRLRTSPPVVLSIHPEAEARWEAWYNANRRLREHLPPLAREMASKLPSHLASLWLVLHCLWDPEGRESQMRLAQLDGAIALVEYFRAHARRVMVHFGTRAPGTDQGLVSRVATILRDARDWVSRTELSHALHRNVKAAGLEAALAALLAEGQVESVQEGEGVRATTKWRWIGTGDDELDGSWRDDDSFDSYEGTNQSISDPDSAVSGSIDSFDSYESMTLPIVDIPAARPRTCFACGGTRFRSNGVCLTCHPDPNASREEIA